MSLARETGKRGQVKRRLARRTGTVDWQSFRKLGRSAKLRARIALFPLRVQSDRTIRQSTPLSPSHLLASRPNEPGIVVFVVAVLVRNNCIGVLRSSGSGVMVLERTCKQQQLLLLQDRCRITGAVGKGDHRSVFVVRVSDVMIPLSNSNSSGTKLLYKGLTSVSDVGWNLALGPPQEAFRR